MLHFPASPVPTSGHLISVFVISILEQFSYSKFLGKFSQENPTLGPIIGGAHYKHGNKICLLSVCPTDFKLV